jgi:heterogeneous nuclear ribonucleoprotein K
MSELNSNMGNEDNGQQNNNNNNVNNSSNGTNRGGNASGHGRLDVRFLVCSRDAGAIIGKKGSNIQALRQKHKVIIQVPDCDGPERVLTIQGDYDSCLAAIIDILPTMRDNQRVQNDQSEIRLLTHQSQAGAVIGKGGERVRELRSKYNVGMKVFVQCLPFSTERVVALRGRAEDIERCLREVFSILEQTPPRGQMCFYDPYNFDENLSSEYGGFSDIQHGMMMNNQQAGGGGGNGPPPPYRAPRDQMGFQGPPYTNNYPNGPTDNYNQGPLPPAPRPLIMGNDSNYNAPQTQTNQVTIPNNLVSCIIGPRGTKIAQIRQTSGASIRIDDPAPGSND